MKIAAPGSKQVERDAVMSASRPRGEKQFANALDGAYQKLDTKSVDRSEKANPAPAQKPKPVAEDEPQKDAPVDEVAEPQDVEPAPAEEQPAAEPEDDSTTQDSSSDTSDTSDAKDPRDADTEAPADETVALQLAASQQAVLAQNVPTQPAAEVVTESSDESSTLAPAVLNLDAKPPVEQLKPGSTSTTQTVGTQFAGGAQSTDADAGDASNEQRPSLDKPSLPAALQETDSSDQPADFAEKFEAAKPGSELSQIKTTLETTAPPAPQQPGEAKLAQPVQAAPQAAPEIRFAEANTENVVRSIRTNLLPGGGSMQIRLDPQELGTLLISVQMRGGALSASFSAANEDAARMLSHNMNHLKAALESSGVTVERLQVQQASSAKDSDTRGGDQRREDPQERGAFQQEQQRREMLRRMWRQVAGGDEPLNLVA